MSSTYILRTWRLTTTAINCMLCPLSTARHVVNAWIGSGEWLTLFVCPICLQVMQEKRAVLLQHLSEKRIHQQEMTQEVVACTPC